MHLFKLLILKVDGILEPLLFLMLLAKLNLRPLKMLLEVAVHDIVRSHSQVPSVTVDNWRLLWGKRVDQTINTISNSQLIGSHY